MLGERRARVGGRAAATGRPRSLYGWAEASAFATPFVAKPAERSHWSRPSTSTASTPRRSRQALRANGIVDIEPYRKLGRNQLRIALFPAIEPDDVAILTRAIDYVVERLPAGTNE